MIKEASTSVITPSHYQAELGAVKKFKQAGQLHPVQMLRRIQTTPFKLAEFVEHLPYIRLHCHSVKNALEKQVNSRHFNFSPW